MTEKDKEIVKKAKQSKVDDETKQNLKRIADTLDAQEQRAQKRHSFWKGFWIFILVSVIIIIIISIAIVASVANGTI